MLELGWKECLLTVPPEVSGRSTEAESDAQVEDESSTEHLYGKAEVSSGVSCDVSCVILLCLLSFYHCVSSSCILFPIANIFLMRAPDNLQLPKLVPSTTLARDTDPSGWGGKM